MIRRLLSLFEKKLKVVARRPVDHPKGEKELMRVPLGNPIPPGVILGKGTVITVE